MKPSHEPSKETYGPRLAQVVEQNEAGLRRAIVAEFAADPAGVVDTYNRIGTAIVNGENPEQLAASLVDAAPSLVAAAVLIVYAGAILEAMEDEVAPGYRLDVSNVYSAVVRVERPHERAAGLMRRLWLRVWRRFWLALADGAPHGE